MKSVEKKLILATPIMAAILYSWVPIGRNYVQSTDTATQVIMVLWMFITAFALMGYLVHLLVDVVIPKTERHFSFIPKFWKWVNKDDPVKVKK